MKAKLLILLVLLNCNFLSAQEAGFSNETTIQLTRLFSKELFDKNSTPFMEPLVTALNSTSNSRFFHTAHVPKQVDKPYFRVSVNGMLGFVREQDRSFAPDVPSEQFTTQGLFANGLSLTGNMDTARVINYLFKTVIYDAVNSQNANYRIIVPERAATVLGSIDSSIVIPGGALSYHARNRIGEINNLLRTLGQDTLNENFSNGATAVLDGVPTFFTLQPGGDFWRLIAGVPQFEIGSLWGTEMLIRFIPPVNMGREIGDFNFYGFGLKHSISQYFDDPSFDMAIQGVVQSTTLKNKVGVTGADLTATANMFNLNLQFSKGIKDWFNVYGGISFDRLNITSKFVFFLPVEIQRQVGLLDPGNGLNENDPNYKPPQDYPTDGFPGDQDPQTSTLALTAVQTKLILGIHKEIADFGIGKIDTFIDYNYGVFSILTAGIAFNF